ncbi:zinc finger protein 26 [Nilaparvata lugens]|uniref:zinc finger protein 26 n=1 Tax=Nilaparvata lugens TaxID=108931 RepID=UPI00193CBDD0|nr:zinc finger protein 26 [Nilaparvata lugens]
MTSVVKEADNSLVLEPECSSAWSPIDNDHNDHQYSNRFCQIFVKEEVQVEDNGELSAKVDCNAEKGKLDMRAPTSSTSSPANTTQVDGDNALLIPRAAVEKSMTDKKTKLYSCAHCSFKTPWPLSLKIHVRRHNGEKPFSCEFCDHRSACPSDLRRHIRTHTGEKPFSCEFCDYTCARLSSLKKHLKTPTGEKHFTCTFCDFTIACSAGLKIHLLTHSNENPFHCDFCDYSCASSIDLKKHLKQCRPSAASVTDGKIKLHSSTEKEDCSTVKSKLDISAICSTTSPANPTEIGGLISKDANPIAPVPVDECNEASVADKNNKLLCCTHCSFKTSRASSLRIHVRRHTGHKPFSCNICNYRSACSSDLRRHIRTHTGEKPFICEYCGFSCTRFSSLKRHIRKHIMKTFSCKFCDFTCDRSASLKSHLLTHSEKNTFHCELCNYTCASSNYLERHIKTHTGENPYSCEICGNSYARSSCLRRHLKKCRPAEASVADGETKSKLEINPTTCKASSPANATVAGGLISNDAHSITPVLVEECTEASVAGERTKLYSCAHCSFKTPWSLSLKIHVREHTRECADVPVPNKKTKSKLEIHPSTCTTSAPTNTIEEDENMSNDACPISPVPVEKEECNDTCVADSKTKLYSCSHCGFKTPWSLSLKIHIRRHTGDKPFSCEICDHRFACPSDLRRHIRTHTGEKPFSCEFCDYKCARLSSLKKHLRTPTGKKHFTCTSCDFTIACSAGFKNSSFNTFK